MRIAVSSQNKLNVTGHAGKASRFWIYDVDKNAGRIVSKNLIELERADILHMRFHESTDPYAEHPVLASDVVITGGAGQGFIVKMAKANVRVAITPEKNPDTAVNKLMNNILETINPEVHHHHN